MTTVTILETAEGPILLEQELAPLRPAVREAIMGALAYQQRQVDQLRRSFDTLASFTR